MSETEMITGKMREIILSKEITFEKFAKRILKSKGINEYWGDDWLDTLTLDYENEYAYINGKLYEMIDYKSYDIGDSVFEAVKNADNTISFVVSYYNGGCSFNEALETAIENLTIQKR